MKFFIKLFSLLLISAAVLGFWMTMLKKSQPQVRKYVPAAKPCRTPLKYALGPVDPRFNISPEKIKDLLGAAENLWEKNSGLNLFEYSPEAELKVRLAYDARQQQTFEAEQMEVGLNNLDTQRISLEKQQSAVSGEYENKFSVFKKALNKYEDRLAEYNKAVSRWNSQGGTSEDEYDSLKKEERAIKKEFEELKEKEAELNALAKKSNTIVTQENKIINNYNQTATTFKSKFGNSREFEKGIFDPNAGITIYQFKEISDLELTLIHELGHALGIGHTATPQSAMYYMIGEQDLDNPTLTKEDMRALRETCQLE